MTIGLLVSSYATSDAQISRDGHLGTATRCLRLARWRCNFVAAQLATPIQPALVLRVHRDGAIAAGLASRICLLFAHHLVLCWACWLRRMISWARLEQIVALRDVLEGGIEATAVLLAQPIRRADTMTVAELASNWRDYVATLVRNHDCLTGHRGSLIRS